MSPANPAQDTAVQGGDRTADDLLRAAAARLEAAGVDAPRRDARALLAAAMGLDEAALLADPERSIARDAAERFQSFVERRAARMPVARILGEREFWSLNFAIGPGVLDPRPDSETLVEAALVHVDATAGRTGAWRVLDLGTGSGCLLLALLSELPRATGVGLERDADAAALASANAGRHGLDGRAEIRTGGWADLEDGGRFDLIVANPPYIPTDEIVGLAPEVARYDPAGALDGGPDGLDAYRDLAPRLAGWLAPGGQAFLEVGHEQGPAVQALLRATGLRLPVGVCDLAGTLRCVRAAVT